MFLVGDASEWFLPMPVSLVVVGLVFAVWKRAAPRAKKLRRTTGLLVAVAFVALSTPAVINLGVQWLEGRPIPVTAQLDALGAPPAPLLRLSASERLALGYDEPDFGNVGDGGNVPGQVPLAAPHVVHGGHVDPGGQGTPPGALVGAPGSTDRGSAARQTGDATSSRTGAVAPGDAAAGHAGQRAGDRGAGGHKGKRSGPDGVARRAGKGAHHGERTKQGNRDARGNRRTRGQKQVADARTGLKGSAAARTVAGAKGAGTKGGAGGKGVSTKDAPGTHAAAGANGAAGAKGVAGAKGAAGTRIAAAQAAASLSQAATAPARAGAWGALAARVEQPVPGLSLSGAVMGAQEALGDLGAGPASAVATFTHMPDVNGMCIPAGDVTLATQALPANEPLRIQAVIVPSSGAEAPNGRQARLDQGGYMRLRAGIEAWRRTGGLLLLMGGIASAPEYALSSDMRRVALDMGVPDEAIRVVPMSRTTWEDIHGAARILREEGLDPKKGVLLVTSALHMHRSMAVARSVGIDPVPLCSDYRQLEAPTWAAWFPNNGAPWNARAMLHELMGVWYYRLRGRA